MVKNKPKYQYFEENQHFQSLIFDLYQQIKFCLWFIAWSIKEQKVTVFVIKMEVILAILFKNMSVVVPAILPYIGSLKRGRRINVGIKLWGIS